MRIYLCLLLSCIVFMGCQQTIKTPEQIAATIEINDSLVNLADFSVPDDVEIFGLSDEQRQHFLDYYNQKLLEGKVAHQIVAEYIQNMLVGFTYDEKTYLAADAIRRKAGNCVSYALVTAAFATLAGIDFDFREVTRIPIFEQKSGVLFVVGHMQTRLYDPSFVEEDGYVYFTRPNITIDYLPESSDVIGRVLNKNEFLSVVYRNLSAELLVNGENEKAFAYANKSWRVQRTSVEAINLLAILHRKFNDDKTAEGLYKSAIAINANNLSVLNNYKILLSNQGREKESAKLDDKMALIHDPNPYRWLQQAYAEEIRGDKRRAEYFYKETLKAGPYVKDAYVGLYELLVSEGKLDDAELVLQQAFPWLYGQEERNRFKSKLFALKGKMKP